VPFNIPAIDDITQLALAGRLQNLLDNKTKPVGSLGQIERLAQRIGLVLGSETPTLSTAGSGSVTQSASPTATLHGGSPGLSDSSQCEEELLMLGMMDLNRLKRTLAVTILTWAARLQDPGQFAAASTQSGSPSAAAQACASTKDSPEVNL
jgi:NaMN:DMB phosphoribosyltransferase